MLIVNLSRTEIEYGMAMLFWFEQVFKAQLDN
jgi:hypothetical protein